MQKTPEDEAFDELERRRGGFRAKRAMAAAKFEWLTGCPTCGMDAECDCDTAASVLGDQVKYGASWSKSGERIDPMSVYNEPAQETAFGWIKQSELAQARLYGGSVNLWLEKHDCDFPVYIAPPQRKPLTDEAVLDIADYYLYNGGKSYGILEFARAIEAAHGIKGNT